MSKRFLLASFLFLSAIQSTLHAQLWTPHWQGADFQNGVQFFPGENFGYAGFENFFFKLNDYGNSWEAVYFDDFKKFLAIDFATTQEGWALMQQDLTWYVQETNDGGVSWIDHGALPDGFGNYTSIYVVNDNLLFAIVDTKVFRSINLGGSWTQVLTINDSVTGIHSNGFDNNKLWASGGNGKVYTSTNEGVTWTLVSIGVTFNAVLDIQFTNANTIYALIGGSNALRKSVDGGMNWTDVLAGSSNLAMQVLNDNEIFVSISNGILHTINGGSSWDTEFTWPDSRITYHFFDTTANNKILVGFDGQIYHSDDDGSAWTEINSGVNYVIGMDFINTAEGWAVGGSGFINILIHTTNAGENWNIANSPSGITNIDFFDAMNGYAIGSSGIHRTTDGGANWIQKSSTITSGKLVVVDALNVHVLSNNITVHNSFDGGETWTTGAYNVNLPLVAFPLYDLEFVDAMNGRLSGDSGYVYFTSDGGLNWIKNNTIGATLDLPECFFITNNIGWYSTQNLIYKTINGGNSWTSTSLALGNGYLGNMHFYDASNGLAVKGFGGVFSLMQTTNGGTVWTDITPPYITTQSLGKIWRSNASQGFIASSDLGILKQDDSFCPLPVFTASITVENPQACIGGTGFISFDANTDISSVMWYHEGLLISTNETLIISNVAENDSGAYEVNLSNTNGCGEFELVLQTTFTAIEDVAPIVSISSNEQILCEGETLSLSASTSYGSFNSALWYQDGNYIAQGETLEFPSVEAFQSGTYWCVCSIGSVCGTFNVTSNSIVISISESYELYTSAPPAIDILCESQPYELSAFASGYPEINFEWSVNDMVLSTSANLIIDYVTNEMDGELALTISGIGGCANEVAEYFYDIEVIPLAEVFPPTNSYQVLPVCFGETVTLEFLTDTPADFYEWYLGEALLGFASTLTVSLIDDFYYGDYYCWPYYGNDCVYSTEPFLMYTLVEGTDVEIIPTEQNMVLAGCGDPLQLVFNSSIEIDSYEWSHNDEVIGTNQVLTITPGENYYGEFYCTVSATNSCGTATETFLMYTVYAVDPYPITWDLVETMEACTGATIEINANASTIFPGVLEIQWYVNDEPISNEVSFEFTPPSPGPYWFDVVMSVNWACGTVVESDVMVLSVFDGPQLPTDIVAQELLFCEDETTTLTCTIVLPGAEMSYEWTLNGEVVSTQQTFDVLVHNGTVGEYLCEVTAVADCGVLQSTYSLYFINLYEFPDIYPVESNVFYTVCEGNPFFLAGTGTEEAESYAWYFNGNVISTEQSFTQFAPEAGEYFLTVSSPSDCGTFTLYNILMYTVEVVGLPQLPEETEFQELSVCEGESTIIAFIPEIEGATYAWEFEGQLLSETGSFLEIPNVDDWEGEFSCTVTLTNECGSVSQFYEVAIIITDEIVQPTITVGDEWIWVDDIYSAYEWIYAGDVVSTTDSIPNYGGGDYSLTITNSTGCEWTETFSVLSVDESENVSLELFPNPASDVFTLKSSHRILSIEVYNAVGELVFSHASANSKLIQINAVNWSGGVYQVVVRDQNEQMNHKRIVVQR
ncbi:MAG: T9SS type A sorting domain-containing protein [Flavobacteriales bacterium]|nr:T9SS type A sorting domain-containing protein [Flavobacteriales bacterium]